MYCIALISSLSLHVNSLLPQYGSHIWSVKSDLNNSCLIRYLEAITTRWQRGSDQEASGCGNESTDTTSVTNYIIYFLTNSISNAFVYLITIYANKPNSLASEMLTSAATYTMSCSQKYITRQQTNCSRLTYTLEENPRSHTKFIVTKQSENAASTIAPIKHRTVNNAPSKLVSQDDWR